jgi:hypothetical protein
MGDKKKNETPIELRYPLGFVSLLSIAAIAE